MFGLKSQRKHSSNIVVVMYYKLGVNLGEMFHIIGTIIIFT